MSTDTDFNPFKQYEGKGPKRRQRFVRWFHNSRLDDFSDLIEPDSTLLSVGCGNAELESKILMDRFEWIYTLEIREKRAKNAHNLGLMSVHGSAVPLPFANNSFDAVMAAGTIEHIPDERAFLESVLDCIKPGGKVYLTLPIEVGVGGWIRYIAKNFVHPDRSDSPDGFRRYFDYSFAELSKSVDRDVHGTSHRYYNYTHAIDDIRELFSNVSVQGWPISFLGSLNFMLLVKAEKPTE